ncbi:MAG: hypothetical protein V4642_10425 [Bacteroidota bacterium]
MSILINGPGGKRYAGLFLKRQSGKLHKFFLKRLRQRSAYDDTML